MKIIHHNLDVLTQQHSTYQRTIAHCGRLSVKKGTVKVTYTIKILRNTIEIF